MKRNEQIILKQPQIMRLKKLLITETKTKWISKKTKRRTTGKQKKTAAKGGRIMEKSMILLHLRRKQGEKTYELRVTKLSKKRTLKLKKVE